MKSSTDNYRGLNQTPGLKQDESNLREEDSIQLSTIVAIRLIKLSLTLLLYLTSL